MVVFQTEPDTVTALLKGEIDHHSAKAMRQQIDGQIHDLMPKKLNLDFGGVTFMDSSGIGLIMGRYRNMEALGGSVAICNAKASMRRMMQFAGLDRLVHFE
jgi:stage II sporulation protein AA (anti-sigma F factor antagonist)